MTGPHDYYEFDGSRRVPRWLPKKAPAEAASYEQPPDSGISVRAATDALQAAPDLERFTDVFDHTVDDEHGAFAQMHQFLESAASWCTDRGALVAADELKVWVIRLEELIEDASLLTETLAVDLSAASLLSRSQPDADTRAPATSRPATTNVAGPTRRIHGPAMESTPDAAKDLDIHVGSQRVLAPLTRQERPPTPPPPRPGGLHH
ncbi:hypothetical protein [Streptomyces sp. NPDC091416]|uniref:hypothetical protein n=1 Tax=Streptomyces sp. NPDC091416 TaxID=3366003 RepID=UPI003812137C